jgi:hypothetical protein
LDTQHERHEKKATQMKEREEELDRRLCVMIDALLGK